VIYTFYSYKGGVGHTTALANIAELFYQAGLRVLIIDWDLITPGLERYFPSLDVHAAIDHPGLIDMLLQYKKYMSTERDENVPFELEDPSRYLIPIYNDGFGPGSLHLLPAGRRQQGDTEYIRAVTTFSWQDFYDVWEGELYFNWLREQFEKIADIVLIDCRSGISEMGSVCTYHWADVIVMFCASSQHDLQGTYEMAQKFTAERVRQARVSHPLQVVIVPSRIGDHTKSEQLFKLKQEFIGKFNRQNFPIDSGLVTTGDDVWSLLIPQIFSDMFADRPITQQFPDKRHEPIYQAYCRLTEYLAQLAPEASRIRELIKSNQLQSRSYIARKTDSLSNANEASQYQLKPGLSVETLCEVNLRPTPGYIGKPSGETIPLEQGTRSSILDGPKKVDDLFWWQIECRIDLCKLPEPIHWRQKNFPRNLAVHSTDPSKVIIERSHGGTLVVLGWIAEKTPNGVIQLQVVIDETPKAERRLLPDSPAFEIPAASIFNNAGNYNAKQEEQHEVIFIR
jgi:MinD-like ATPase involved in chromosome partitioning or flagellar assembly